MGQTISQHLEQETGSWSLHHVKFAEDYRQKTLRLLQIIFPHVKSIALCYTENTMFQMPYQHYYVTLNHPDGQYFIEFQGDIISSALVVLRNDKFAGKAVQIEQTSNPKEIKPILLRITTILGMCNYSLTMRNCEHVARWIYSGLWYSVQSENGLNNPFSYFLSHCKTQKKLVNTPPEGLIKDENEFKQEKKGSLSSSSTKFTVIYSSSDTTGVKITRDTFVIVLLGPTGAGKSRLVNVFFDNYVADSRRDVSSISVDVKFHYGTFSGLGVANRHICIVDTIGIGDTRLTPKELQSMLVGKINRNVTHFNKVVMVAGNRLDRSHMKNLAEIMESVGAAKIKCTHFILSYYEGTDAITRLKSVTDALLRGDVQRLFDANPVSFTVHDVTYEVPRGICTGFADNPLYNHTEEGRKCLAKDREEMIKLLMYPSDNVAPTSSWSNCAIL